ncbi:hypothetical protein PPERSA_05117 [Pseudocohnilembus persalinus]|uniref:Ion transport domain-containing protein n=1 Tax=Pseudocohnilembus persalinus TaxID=266149 RepID=A0A0V0QX43_PSEPJ|nr:hypothetical protein PPERSA_05117 [Pseudocohnilembus persalinus]|eukprot:KRX06504.1 hypothetical protein PPERSA_05117 [Pseudocohnilembus persalinus]
MQDQRYNYKNITNKYEVLKRYPQEYIVGNLFILIDLFCGPVALLIDLHFIISNQIFTSIYLSDVFRMLKIFSLTKIRILIKDIFHVVPLASDIFAAMVFVYYIFSFQGFVIFHNIHPDYFGNLFISMLSMFQVTTFDSWNYQITKNLKRKNKQWVQMTTLFISGVIGFLLDIYVVKYQGIKVMIYGGMLRNMVLLVTPQCIFSFSKLFTVIKEVGPLTILNVLTLFILSIIGYVGLHGFDKEWNLYFENLIQTFLFLLQVITFDTWGDIARSAIQTNKMWAIYFVIVVVFVGFFLQNLMIGQIATIVQPSTAKKFHKNYILDKKVPQEYAEALNKLNQQEKRKQENQQYNLQDAKNLLEKFKKSSNGQPLQIFIDNQVFEITSKDLINIK